MWRPGEKMVICEPGNKALQTPSWLNLGLPASELSETNYWCLLPTQAMAFCYSSLNSLRVILKLIWKRLGQNIQGHLKMKNMRIICPNRYWIIKYYFKDITRLGIDTQTKHYRIPRLTRPLVSSFSPFIWLRYLVTAVIESTNSWRLR